jgi:hypothetical protein
MVGGAVTQYSGHARKRELGEGPLARVVSLVYTVLAVEGLAVLTTMPALVLLMLLDRDASNLALAAFFAIPLGPAAAAALYTLHHRRSDLTDLKPAAAFWRGYRTNLVPVLRLWLPWLAWMALVAFILAHYEDAGIPAWWAGLLVLLAVAAALWGANALVICSLFAFRARDTARLAVYFLWRTPGVTLANACLLVLAAGVTVLWSEVVVVLLASLFAGGLVGTTRPMVAEIQERFAA